MYQPSRTPPPPPAPPNFGVDLVPKVQHGRRRLEDCEHHGQRPHQSVPRHGPAEAHHGTRRFGPRATWLSMAMHHSRNSSMLKKTCSLPFVPHTRLHPKPCQAQCAASLRLSIHRVRWFHLEDAIHAAPLDASVLRNLHLGHIRTLHTSRGHQGLPPEPCSLAESGRQSFSSANRFRKAAALVWGGVRVECVSCC